jgi:hypothetical protein
MEGPLAIGGLALLVVFAVWFLVSEAKSGATSKEALKASTEVIDGLKRFNKARRDSAGLSRSERVGRMLQAVREGSRPEVPTDE